MLAEKLRARAQHCRPRDLYGYPVVLVVNDRGQLRSYPADRIAGVAVTREAFRPRYVIDSELAGVR